MLGALFIAIPGYGVALWLSCRSFACLLGWASAEAQSPKEHECAGGMILSAAGAMFFGFVTNWLLGVAL